MARKESNQTNKNNLTGIKNVYFKIIFLISQPEHNYVVGAQKNRLIETVLLSTQNIMLKLMDKKTIKI